MAILTKIRRALKAADVELVAMKKANKYKPGWRYIGKPRSPRRWVGQAGDCGPNVYQGGGVVSSMVKVQWYNGMPSTDDVQAIMEAFKDAGLAFKWDGFAFWVAK